MDYKEFLTKYKNTGNKESFIKKHITKIYLPYANKVAESKNIVKKTCYNEVNGKLVYQQDSPSFFSLFMLRVISNYTDITYENGLELFDAFSEAGVFEKIIQELPSKEFDSFNTILHMVKDDEMENYRSLAGILDTKIEAINIMLDALVELVNEQKKINDDER